MAWSSSLNNKFAKIQPKEEEKKQNSSFYDDFQSRRSENSGSIASTPSVKSTSSNTSSSKKISSSSKQSGSSSGSRKTAPTTTFGNSTKFFKGYQTYQERKKNGNVFTPSTVMGKTAISDKPKMSEIIPNVTIDLEKKLGNLITNYEKIATSEGSPSEKAKRIHEFIADNQDTFNEYSKQTGGDLTIPGLEYMYQKYADKITRQMRVDNNDKESTLRPATLKDLTVNSFTRGITNTMYGEENYKAIAGRPNNAQQYKQELSQDKYQFAPKGLFQKAVSLTSEQLGQRFRNAASPETSAAVAGAAAIALLGGQAGPQAALPEEVITVPSAIAAGYKAGSSASALKTEAGLAYAEMIDNGITPETASKIALGVGTVNSGLEAMQLDDLMKSFKILSKSSATKGIAKQLGEYILKRGGHITTETAQEMAQEATTIAGTQLANKIEKGEWAYNADEVSDRITDTGKSSLLTFAGLGGIGDIAHIGTNAFNVAADNYNNTVQTGQAINNAGAAQDMVDIGLKRDANTSANKYAQKMQQKQSKGADLSDWNVGRQYQKNVKAIDAENKFINDIANVTGTETQVHADMGGVNGQFTSDNGQQRVDISANGDTSVPATVKHEFTHLFKQNAGEAYQAFEDYMYKSAMETNPQAVQDRLASLKKLYEKNGLQYTDEIGKEEIVAEMTDTFEPNVNKIAYGNPNLADKVLNGIRTAKAQIQSALSSPYTNNRTGVQMTYAQLNKAEQLWNNALRQAAENKGNVDSNSVVKNSAKESADITNHKGKQLEIILNRNPALNEYSTWVRNIDDIKTFEETLLDDDWEDGEDFNPDYTWDMAQEAVKTGDITVYSSHPIEQGIFVTPSRMEAESYSGNGNIYEKNVRLSDIAWIDPTQGQYAKIDDKIVKNSVKESTSDAQTKSDNFKQWFGDWENDPENASKVVNEDGTPKVMYHGTLTQGITEFKKEYIGSRYSFDERGFFFIDRESIADDYAHSEFDSSEKGDVIPAYLKIINPLVVDKTFAIKNGMGNIFADRDVIDVWDSYQGFILDEADDIGADGIIVKDGMSTMAVVFEPTQIKSATDNIGTFDGNNPDIRYSVKESASDTQIKSDSFKQWFGDWENDPENSSKVVNEDGTPKVVYHGTNSDFTTFDTQRFNTRENSGDYVGEGFFFADKESTAKKYGSNVMPVYLNLRNPLIINTEQDGENFRSTFLNMYQKGDKELRDLIGGDYDYFSIMEENPSAIRQELQRRGYDGLIDNLYGQYAVFNPNQIKSATDNVGTFDRNNDDIRYSVKENDLSTDKCQKRFAENVDKVFSGEMPKRTVITVGDTPNLLQKYGANDVPITINQSTMYKIAYPTGYFGAEKQGHNLGIPALKQLPKQIAEPTAILKSNSQDDSMILLTEWEDTHGNPVIIPLRLDKQGEVSFENNISSAYGKQNFDALLTDKQGNSTVLYTQNNEDIQNLIVDRLQLPAAPKEDTLVNYNISNPEENVKFSIKESRDNKAGSMAADIIKSNNSTLKKSDISGEIEEIYSILTNGNVTDEKFQSAWSKASDIGRRIAETSQITDVDTSDEYKRLLNWVRNTPVSISDTDKADIGGVDSFNEFRKKNFGSIRLTNSGTPIDIAYQELSQQFPQYFDAQNETHPADQLTRIQDILQDLKPTMRTLSDEERSGVADDVAVKLITDIMNNNDIQLSDSNFFDDMPNGKKLSQLFTNTMQKGAYTGEFKSEAERRKTEFMYEGITNKETYEAAQADISNRGDDTVLAELSMKDGGWSAEDTAKSLALMAKYQSENNTSKAVDVASMLREKMTQAGQAVQALKIVNKLTPEGQFLDFVRQAEKMVDEQIEKHPANDKIRKELNAAKKKDQARQKKTKETDREHFIPREAEVDTSVPEIDEKYKYGEQETLIPKEPIADDNTEPSIGTPVNGEQETLIPKSYYDEVLDKFKIDHLSAEDMQQVNDTLKTLDTLDDKNDLINLILKQSKERKTASHALVKKALEGQNIEFLKDTALMQVFGKISDKMPSSLAQKASTYQAMSHLLNARTMMRNITSNTAFNTVDRISTDIGSIVDSLIGVFSGKRTVGVDRGVFEKGRFRASADRAAQQYLDIALAVNHETDSSKYNLNPARRTFKGRTIGGLERGMSYGLQVTDEWSKGGIEYNIKKSLERLKKSGFTAEEIDNIAKFEAKYRTFQDDTKLGQILKGLKDTLNVIGVGETKQLGRLKSHEFGLGDLVQKYTQVPGALITRSVEYSPLGYCKALYNIGKAVYNKSKGADFSAADQRNIALSLGRAMTGTGLIALFAGLSGLGIFTGEREDKDEKLKAMENAEGISNTQLNLSALSRLISSGGKDAGGRQNGDVLTSLGFLEPLSTLMAMGNAVAEKGSVKNPVDWASAATAKTFDQIMDMSTMSTMRSISNTLTYGGNGWDVAVGTLTDSATGFIPGPVRQLGSFLDTTQRNPYNEENSTDKARERFKASLPWARENVAAKINPYGEEKTTSSGNRAIDFLNNFFSPGYVNIYQTSDIGDELHRLSDINTDVLPHVPKREFTGADGEKYKLYGKDYEEYSRLVGTITTQKMRDIINSDSYKNMSDERRVELLKKAADEGENEAGLKYVLGDDYEVSNVSSAVKDEAARLKEYFDEIEFDEESGKTYITYDDKYKYELTTEQTAKYLKETDTRVNDYQTRITNNESIESVLGEVNMKLYADEMTQEQYEAKLAKANDRIASARKDSTRQKYTKERDDFVNGDTTREVTVSGNYGDLPDSVKQKVLNKSKSIAVDEIREEMREDITTNGTLVYTEPSHARNKDGGDSSAPSVSEPTTVSSNVHFEDGSSKKSSFSGGSSGGTVHFTSARASGGSSSGSRKSSGTSSGSGRMSVGSSGGSSRVQFTARANTGNTSGTAPIGTRSAVSLPNTVNPQLIQAAVDSFMKNKNVSNAVKPLENPLFM